MSDELKNKILAKLRAELPSDFVEQVGGDFNVIGWHGWRSNC